MASRLWLNLGFVEFTKSISSGDVALCRGEPKMLDKVRRFAGPALNSGEKAAVYELLGDTYLWEGKIDDAAAVWRKSEYPLSRFLAQARHHHQEGRYICAIDQYQAISLIWPNSSLPWYYMGNTLWAQKDLDRALDAYDRAAHLNDFQEDDIGLGDVYIQKGEVLRDLGSVIDAYNSYSRAVSIGEFSTPSREAWALYKQGEMLVWMKRYPEATAPLLHAVEVSPRLYNAYSLLGVVAFHRGHAANAISYLEQAVEIEPKYFWSYLHLARIYSDMGMLAIAVDYYHKVLDLNPGNRDAVNELGELEE